MAKRSEICPRCGRAVRADSTTSIPARDGETCHGVHIAAIRHQQRHCVCGLVGYTSVVVGRTRWVDVASGDDYHV